MSDPLAATPSGGVFTSLVELRAVQARLGERRRHESTSGAFWDAVDEFVRRGCATGVLLDNADERWTIQGLLDYWAAALERSGRSRRDSSLVEFDAALAPELPDDACPYVGLNAFQEANIAAFFGRDALLDKLVQQLGEHRLIALVGPSGSGKSSLASGLVSRLRKGALPGSEMWHVLPAMVPGAHPGAALASRLQDLPFSSNATLVVVVDQFEELFTLCESEDERAAFVADLLSLVTRSSPPHRVVLTVRSDFESLVARQPALYEHYDAGRVAVTPPSAAELRQAITGPAAMVGLKFEAGVTDLLIQDLLGEPAGLPLLQFTLLRLWKERERNRVTMGCYHRVGGGCQALARAADAVYDRMIPEDQATARRILLRLSLAVDDRHEPTRMRVPRAQLVAGCEDPGRVERVVDNLIAARLVRQTPAQTTAAPEVEVAHEALVRNWPRLAEWLQEAQGSLAERRRLEARAADWVRRGRTNQALLDDVELRDAERWQGSAAGKSLTFSDPLRALIAASRRHLVRAAQRRRMVILANAAISVVLAVSLGEAVYHYRSAQRARAEERESQIETRRLLGMSYLEQGRGVLLSSYRARPMRALPYLVAARAQGIDSAALRMLFGQASRNLPAITLVGHAATVNDAAASFDGTRVVTACADHTARIWELATGQLLAPPLVHRDAVLTAAFSPDGTRAITASVDNTARIWDAATGRPLASPLVHRDSLRMARFSPDGTRVVTASEDNTARIWDAATGQPVGAPLGHHDTVWMAVFSADGARVATASDDMTARIWDAATGQPVSPPLGHRRGVGAVAFSPDGTRVVTASDDGTAQIWDAATGGPLTLPLVHQGPVHRAVFSPDGLRVVTASDDNMARIWNAATGEQAGVLDHAGAVTCATFSPDGTRVITASDDKLVRIWSASTAPRLVLEHREPVAVAVFSPDGARLVTASWDRTAQIWNASTGELVASLDHQGVVSAVAFSHDGRRIATASNDRTARVWDAATGQPVSLPLAHHAAVSAVAFSPDGTRVITASDDKMARIWDVSTSALAVPPLGHQGVVSAVAFSPDGARVITASDDKMARIWDVSTGRLAAPPLVHQAAVSAVAFSPDGVRVVTASADRTARIWLASTGRQLTTPLEHRATVRTAAFSPDGTRVVTASKDNTARVWDSFSGLPETPPLEHSGSVAGAAFSPDGTLVVTASYDNTARIWDVSTGNPVSPPLMHTRALTAAAFSPDGTRLVTTGLDRAARIWDLRIDRRSLDDWQLVARCSPFALVNGVLTSNPDPRRICPAR